VVRVGVSSHSPAMSAAGVLSAGIGVRGDIESCQNSLSSPRSGQKYRSSPSLIPPSIVFFRTDVELHHVPNDADFG
jgi:hypothetical protein